MKKQTKFGLVLAAAAVISVSVASLVGARGWVQQGADWYYLDGNNDPVTETIQSSGSAKFYLGENGAMVRDYFLEDDGNGNTYYFGSNGAMVTNTWVAIDSSVVDATGDYVPDNYWYYFQSSGKAMKGSTTGLKKATIDGKKYAFNQYGQMSVGWVDDMGDTTSPDNSNPFEGALYYCGGDNDGALRSGWVTYYDGYADADGNKADYTNLYFYFNPSNNKLVSNETKKINGRTYAFDSNGVMLSGWDVYEDDNLLGSKVVYFSGEDDGHQVKNGWVYDVPAEGVSKSANEDNEEKYMYFGSDGVIKSGDVVKVNGKWYVFDNEGIMKTGIVILNNSGTVSAKTKFFNTIDTDYAKGSDVAKKGIIQYGADSTTAGYYIVLDPDGTVRADSPAATGVVLGTDKMKLHYFGDDGARKTGINSVEFNDDVYALNTSNGGDRGSGEYKKKYYSLGIALKADSDLKYGVYAVGNHAKLIAQSADTTNTAGETVSGWVARLALNEQVAGITDQEQGYYVLTTSGSLQKGSNNAKKDGNGNYWLIRPTSNRLEGIYTANTKMGTNSVKAGLTISRTFAFNMTDAAGIAPAGSRTATYSETAANAGAFDITGVTAADIDNYTAFHDRFDDAFALPTTNFADVPGIADLTWTIKVNKEHTSATVVSSKAYSGKAYQSSYNGKSNVWLPWYVVDDDAKNGNSYVLQPESLDDSYFLNCFWKGNRTP